MAEFNMERHRQVAKAVTCATLLLFWYML
jgi:hypothetical protein